MQKPTHSPIGASSYYRWKACPGSVRLSQGIESKSSIYAQEGTLAHEIAALILQGQELDPKVVSADQEMLDAISVYTKTVNKEEGFPLLVEHAFDLSDVFPGLYGTADAIIFHEKSKTLKVFDYKHGAGIPVDVEHNTQLMYYGLGALISSDFVAEHVELVIVQPRCQHIDGPVRRWSLNTFDLLEFAGQLKQDAEIAMSENAPLQPGDHCRFCPAAGMCPALKDRALSVAKTEFAVATAYDPDELAKILTRLPLLEDWISSVREFAYGEASKGKSIPGYKLVAKRATRRWKDNDYAVSFLKEKCKLKVKAMYGEPSLKSPAQIEKLLTKEQQSQMEDLIEAVSSGNTLAPESDKRPAVKQLTASEEFGAIEMEKTNEHDHTEIQS